MKLFVLSLIFFILGGAFAQSEIEKEKPKKKVKGCNVAKLLKGLELTQREKRLLSRQYKDRLANYSPMLYLFLTSPENSEKLDQIITQLHFDAESKKRALAQRLYEGYSSGKKGTRGNKRVLCSRIKSIKIAEESGRRKAFSEVEVRIYADEANEISYSMTKEQYDRSRLALFDRVVGRNGDEKTFKWAWSCELKLSPEQNGENAKSNIITCILPNFEIEQKDKVRQFWFTLKYPVIVTKTPRWLYGKTWCGDAPKLPAIEVRERDLQRKKRERIEIWTPNENSDYKTFAKGEFGGRVIDWLTKLPIEGASVSFDKQTDLLSDNEGKYSFSNVEMSMAGHKIEVEKFYQYQPNSLVIDHLEPEDFVDGYDIELMPRKVRLEGTVYSGKDQTPITNEVVSLLVRLKLKNGQIFTKTYSAKTDDFGKYSIDEIEMIYNLIDFVPSSNAFNPKKNLLLTMNGPEDVFVYDVELEPNYTRVSGRVTDRKTLEPVSGIKVTLEGLLKEDGSPYSAITDSMGNYKIIVDEHPITSVVSKSPLKIQANKNREDNENYNQGTKSSKLVNYLDGGVPRDYREKYWGSRILMYGDNPERDLILEPYYRDVEGTIRHLQTEEIVANAPVQLIQNGEVVAETIADATGRYRFRFLKEGSYTVRSEYITGANNEIIYDPDQKNFSIDRKKDVFVDLNLSKIDVIGKVYDGKTKKVIPNATVRMFYRGYEHEVRTDSNGSYIFHSVPNGDYEAKGIKDEYVGNSVEFTVLNNTKKVDIHLVKIEATKGHMVIVLQWDDNPRDLDTQLINKHFHLYYKTRHTIGGETPYDKEGFYAGLDTDAVSGYGPETVTIRLNSNGSPKSELGYAYLVYKYSGYQDLVQSSARVTIFQNGEVREVFKISDAEPSKSRLWHPFDITDEGEIVRYDRLEFKEQYDKIAAIQTQMEPLIKEEKKRKKARDRVKGKVGQIARLENKLAEMKKDIEKFTGYSIERALQNFEDDEQIRYRRNTGLDKLEDEISSIEGLIRRYSPRQLNKIQKRIDGLEADILELKETEDDWSEQDKIDFEELSLQLSNARKARRRADKGVLEKDLKHAKREFLDAKKRLKKSLSRYPGLVKELSAKKLSLSEEEIQKVDELERRVKVISKKLEVYRNQIRAIEAEVAEALRVYL